ncbi:MAG TPA: ACT domain-containing protein [Candidatus Krumholzibacteria bacterium]|nr:ACT domain-containing protein [Candidatus Krumholzibacteria bacterium]HPD72412.1 ACT domain-containing protein [Candidatus Krumholzibacteria bacterium]HRY40656.1 ACT domain-containing protein [Candidatus Krumholzibacteria bacterium]
MTGKIAVGGITRTDDLVVVRVLGARSSDRFAGRTLNTLGKAGINITCCACFSDDRDRQNLAMAIHRQDLDQALGLLQGIREEIGAERIEVRRRCSAIAIYGPQFSSSPAIAGRIFDATDRAGIEVQMISTSFTTVAILIDTDCAEPALAGLRETFVAP